jgi:beta-lactamase regulating signal transducer with metallopeptidase domain
VIAHLLLSTLMLGLAMLAARFLPLAARTRYALVFLGLAKFAVPVAAVAALLRALGLNPARAALTIPFRILSGVPAAAVPAAASVNWLVLPWATVAALMLVRWFLLRHHTVRAALQATTAPSSREVRMLAAARQSLELRAAVEVVRSAIAEAPAVLRVLRPVIVLPAGGCDALEDDELHSLFLHECTHVARRDNFLAIVQAVAGAALWFHPLVWLAQRQLAAAREEACDEAVADRMRGTGAYLAALGKLCRAILAPRPAGVSCMASANIKQRMEHLMTYERIRVSSLPHRVVLTVSLLTILATTAGATLLRDEGTLQDDRYVSQRAAAAEEGGGPYTGQPITIKLKDASLQDVLAMFAQLTGLEFDVAPGITGTVTIELVDVPWDQALEIVAKQNGLTVTVEGKIVHIR